MNTVDTPTNGGGPEDLFFPRSEEADGLTVAGTGVRGAFNGRTSAGLLRSLLGAACILATAGTGRARSVTEQTRMEDLSVPPVQISLTITPATLRLDRDVLLSFHVSAPSEIDVEFPPLDDRLEGFELTSRFTTEPEPRDGVTSREYRFRLTPLIATTYRLAPMAVTYTDRSTSPAAEGWCATRPVLFSLAPPPGVDTDGGIHLPLKPGWIRPSSLAIGACFLAPFLVIVAAFVAWRTTRRRTDGGQKRQQTSPRELALAELTQLLASEWPERGRLKDFYGELTMIVRRYIERRHAVKAPEQTTEEFLAAASLDSRFGAEVMHRLKGFLEAADLVKFATHRPGAAAVQEAVHAAREYILADSAEAASPRAKSAKTE